MRGIVHLAQSIKRGGSMSRLNLLIPICILIAIFTVSSSPVFACSCTRKPTLPDEFERSNIVAILKLRSLEVPKDDSGVPKQLDFLIVAKMIVEKVFKGDVKVGDELQFRQGGGGDCIWRFEEKSVGGRYLFYLTPPTVGHPSFRDTADIDSRPLYNGSTCGRSGPAGVVDKDIAFLNDLKKYSGRTRVSGTLNSSYFGAPSFANLSIKFIGSTGTYDAKSDKSGFYEIYDLPEGDYSMEFTPPLGWKVSEDYMRYMRDWAEPAIPDRLGPLHQITVSVKKGAHVDLDLGFEMIGALSGRVISPDGAPMNGVSIRAVAFSGLKDWENAWHVQTNKDGEFSFRSLVPGDYVLVVSNAGRMSSKHPFGTIFYPGTEDIQNAARIKVLGPVENVVVQIPSTIRFVEFKGRFLFSDGNPISGQWVGFTPDEPEKYEREEAITDKDGNFRFLIPPNATGKLWGRTYIHMNAAENCPQQKARLLAAGVGGLDVKSNGISVKAQDAKRTVNITLDFPSCEKPKRPTQIGLFVFE